MNFLLQNSELIRLAWTYVQGLFQ